MKKKLKSNRFWDPLIYCILWLNKQENSRQNLVNPSVNTCSISKYNYDFYNTNFLNIIGRFTQIKQAIVN